MVKNPPAHARDTSSIPDSGRSHLPRGNSAHVPRLLGLCYTAREPQQPDTRTTVPEACVPQSLRSATRGATTVSSLHTATREQPLLAPTGEKPAQQRRPSTVKKKKYIYIRIYVNTHTPNNNSKCMKQSEEVERRNKQNDDFRF